MEGPGRAVGQHMGRGLIVLFAVAVGLAVANNYLAQPLLDTLRVRFGVSTVVAGLLVTSAQAGYCLGLLLLTPLGDLLERRRLITTLGLLTTAFLAGAAAAPSIGFLMAAVALIGFTSVMAQILVPFAASLAGDAERGRVVGTVMSGLLLGILLARAVSGAIAQVAGWRSVYVVAAVAMLVMTALLHWRLPKRKEESGLTYPRLLASLVAIARTEPKLQERAIYGGLSFAAITTVLATLAFLLSGGPYHWNEGAIGLFTLFGVGGAMMAIITGRLNDRGWTAVLTVVMPAVMAAGYALMWLGRWSLAPLIVGFILSDLGGQAVHITNQSVIYSMRPEARSRINSVYMTSCFVGMTLGSFTAALAYAHFGWTGVCVLGGCFAGAILPVRGAVWLHGRRGAPEPVASQKSSAR